jgi:hypothetical protein
MTRLVLFAACALLAPALATGQTTSTILTVLTECTFVSVWRPGVTGSSTTSTIRPQSREGVTER